MSMAKTSGCKRALGVSAATALLVSELTLVGASSANAAACGPASKPPTPNTWYDNQGNYRGTVVVSRENYPSYGTPVGAIITYRTYDAGHSQTETWDAHRLRGSQRLECERFQSKPTPPRTRCGGSGGGAVSIGRVVWSIGGTQTTHTGTVTVGPLTNAE